jgi:hypothetical protein
MKAENGRMGGDLKIRTKQFALATSRCMPICPREEKPRSSFTIHPCFVTVKGPQDDNTISQGRVGLTAKSGLNDHDHGSGDTSTAALRLPALTLDQSR